MHIFLAGGTGAIGRRLIPQLLAAGHSVTATTHSPQRLGTLRELGANAVVMDGLDASSVGQAVARAEPDVIIHQMTALSGRPDMRHFDRWFATTNRLRTIGTSHLLSAAQAVGVARFIAGSFTGWNNSGALTAPATETDAFDTKPLPAQRETLAAISALEHSVTTAPLTGIVLRYGGFYGPGATEEMVSMIRKRMIPIIGNGNGMTSFVHVEDAASATVAALTRGSRGVYNIVDNDPARAADWISHMAACVGAKPPLHVPVWLGKLLAGQVVTRIMTSGCGASNAKARRELQWAPRWPSWREGFATL